MGCSLWGRKEYTNERLTRSHFYLIYLLLSGAAQALHCYVRAFSSCDAWGILANCGAYASHCGGFLLQRTRSRVWTGSVVAA